MAIDYKAHHITSHFTIPSTGSTQHQFQKSDLNNAEGFFFFVLILHTHTHTVLHKWWWKWESAAGNTTGFNVFL